MPGSERGALDMPGRERGALDRLGRERGALDMPGSERMALDMPGSERGALDRLGRERGALDMPGSERMALDRSALGRAVHALLERWEPGEASPSAAALERVLLEEFPAGPPDEAVLLLLEMVRRFAASPTGRAAADALARGEDLRREVSFHARIRFPGGAQVGPFDSLLVRGSIDLWLPAGDGVLVVDHKTNPPGRELATPADLARHYAWQLRLYALAVERLVGRDVAGARLLLLDPGWGPDAVTVDVDVGGQALEEARRLCQAFATSALEGRWPADWRFLLAGV
jgi:hypothetical protein